MKRENIINNLKEIISNKLDVSIKINEIDDNIPLFEDGLGLDSIAIVNLIVLIEAEFNFKFQDEEITMSLFQDLNTLASFIEERNANQVPT